MANRRFRDRAGHEWEVRDRSKAEWFLEPVGDNPGQRRVVRPPGYEEDPFELTDQELWRLLEQGGAPGGRGGPGAAGAERKSPFRD